MWLSCKMRFISSSPSWSLFQERCKLHIHCFTSTGKLYLQLVVQVDYVCILKTYVIVVKQFIDTTSNCYKSADYCVKFILIFIFEKINAFLSKLKYFCFTSPLTKVPSDFFVR